MTSTKTTGTDMATAPLIEDTSNALVPANSAAAAIVLFDSDKFDAFYSRLKADVEAVPVDQPNTKGGDDIASVACAVRTETGGIDNDHLHMTKEERQATDKGKGARKAIKEIKGAQ